MKKTIITSIGLLLLTLILSGCSTVMNGPTQDIAVTSNPPGAIVTTTTFEWIRTPGTFKLPRANSTTLTANLYGFETAKQELKCELTPWIFGNATGAIYPWTIIGIEPYIALIMIDLTTGSVGQLNPTDIHFELVSNKKLPSSD